MKHDYFEDTITGLIDAKFKQSEFIRRNAPISVIEIANESVAKARGQAIRWSKEHSDIPSLEDLKSGVVIGLESILRGFTEEGERVMVIAHTVRDVAYQGESLQTEESYALINKIKKKDSPGLKSSGV